MKHILSVSFSALAVACVPEAPATPSFQQDVMPILAANCVRCHAAPQIGGAPEWFRLDTFENVTEREALYPPGDPMCTREPPDPGCSPVVVYGAAELAASAAMRVASDDRPMPPRFRLDDHQIETLENWVATGGLRGAPRPGNASPQAAVESIERSGAILHVTVRVDDRDRDVVGGSLHARIAGTETFVGHVQSGEASVRWDATGVAAGSYPLTARLDDGAAVSVVNLGTITVGGS